MKKILLFTVLITSLCSFQTHKFYVSLTDMEYVKEKESVQIIINVFMDDIEKALNTDYNIDMKISTKNEINNANSYYVKYLNEKLKIKINQIDVNFRFIGKEYEGDLVFFYLEIDNIKSLETLEIKNTLLVQYFENQQNIVKLKKGNQRTSEILSKENDKAMLKF